MALNTRLTQNIDLQADGTALTKALGVIETALTRIVGKSGDLSKELNKGATAGSAGWNKQLKQLNILMGQAQNLQKILDAMNTQKANRLLGGLDEQALGKKGAAASRLAQDLTSTSTAADVLEKRLATLNKRFAELTLAGRTVGQRDLSKQLNTEAALKDVRSLSREFDKLNGQSTRTNGTRVQQENMSRLRTEIVAANAELAKMGQNYRRTDFSPQIAQIRQLTSEYSRAVAEARKFELAQPGRALNAQRSAVGILNQTDSQRLADIKRSSSQFQFPSGISQTTSQQSAEKQLGESLSKRLRLLNMIQAAQDRGAPTRSVERLNTAYKNLGAQLGENYKRLTQVNAEIEKSSKSSFVGQFQSGLGRVGIIAGASVAVAGVYALINAAKDATKFVVEYEAALKQLQAISGSTDEQMGRLSKSIGEVGRNSTYSILEITKAATVIAQAGYSAQETGSVLKDAITLSTASGSDPTQSVEVLTSALGAFQLQASESGRVVDTLVTGLNKSKLSIDQMGAAIQYAGATANEAGVRFEELTTIAASMANAGIRSGSTIGTGIRQLLVDMQTPSEDFKKELKDVGLTLADVDVKAKGFAGVVRTLADAGFTAEAAYSSFETRAASAFLAFKGQIGTYDELALAIAQGGAAAEAQAKSMDSLSAQYNRLKNDLGDLVSSFSGSLLSSLKVVTSLLASFVEGLTDVVRALSNGLDSLGLFGDALTTVGLALTGFAIGGPIGAAIGAFIGITGAIGSASAELDGLRTKTSDAEAQFNTQTQTVNNLDDAINGLVARQGELKTNSTALQTETVTLAERFGDLYTYLGKASTGYDDLLNAMLRYRGAAIQQQKLEAETLQTNATIELNAVRKKLSETSGGRGGSIFNRASVESELSSPAGNDVVGQRTMRIARSALASDDIALVTTARNNVAKYNADNNGDVKNVLAMLEERLGLIKQAAGLQAQVSIATKQIDVANAASSDGATRRNAGLVQLGGAVDRTLNAAQAGNSQLVSPAIAQVQAVVTQMKADLAKLKKGTGEYLVLQNDLSKAESQLARLVRNKREKDEADAKIRPTRAAKGLNLTGVQVKSELTKAFPGANVYSEKPRSLKKQEELYAAYKNGTGALAAKPGTSRHGSGNAIDMTPMKGVSRDQIVAYLEGLGLEVTENLSEKSPTGGTHWHFAWKPKTSSFQKSQDSKAATTLKSLQTAADSASVGKASASIQAIIAKGKAGTDTATNLRSSLQSSLNEYTAASLKQYDNQHPAAGLSGGELQLQQQGRADLVAELKEKADKFVADLDRSIGDEAQKAFEEASAAIKTELDRATYDAEEGVRVADQNITRSSSRLNKDRTGAGTSYYLQQQKEAAQLNTDRATVAAQDVANARTAVNMASWKTQIDILPNGEAKTGQLKAYNDALDSLNASLRITDALQQSINDRTDTYVNELPLEDRLKNAAAAWGENNGVMQDWTTIMENNVGPALDMLSSTFADVFSQIMQGTMGLKGALKSIISAVGQFVVQLIAKALALAAIKWFLKLIGVELIDTPGGVGVQKIPGKLQGGEIKPKMMMDGGPTAGYISQGVANKDTVPILGARGEFMLRKAAVDSLGLENVDAMNKHGAKAVSKMAGATIIPNASRQEMNVYVIKPDEKPQLGPKDVILAITDDMLQGGTTKQLVRKISQGAM